MSEKRVQCHSCKHNMKTTSCGSCVEQGAKMIKSIAKDLELNSEPSGDNEIELLTSSCKIILEYPEEFPKINPYQCKYYLPTALKFY
ncbi:MAG: hypothetical protein P8Y70_08405 [Candidatus Lokiarchaeota archaeon]